MKIISIVLLIVMTMNSVIGANWVEVGKNKEIGQTYYVDRLSVKKIKDNVYPSNQIISYFGKMNFAIPQKLKTDSKKYYKYEVIQFKGDCENNKTSKMAEIFYKSNCDSQGAFYISKDEWKIVFPSTAREMALNYACYIADYRNEP